MLSIFHGIHTIDILVPCLYDILHRHFHRNDCCALQTFGCFEWESDSVKAVQMSDWRTPQAYLVKSVGLPVPSFISESPAF